MIQTLKRMGSSFPVVALTGARQVGKTTLLKMLMPDAQHIVFDPITDVSAAREDPDWFLDQLNPPVILDEIQYVPELLNAIKRRADLNRDPGQYWLTGSQHWSMMKGMSESLAGRVGIATLHPMTYQEQYGEATIWLEAFLKNPDAFLESRHGKRFPVEAANTCIWRGGFPGLLHVDQATQVDLLHSYLLTYIERDVRLFHQADDVTEFSRFIRLMAHHTAHEIQHSQLGRELGLSPNTAKHWLSVVEHTYLWTEIPPYFNNMLKRLSKKPKGVLLDTALACYLMHLSSPDTLLGHPVAGQLFESYVISDVIRQCTGISLKPAIYHWRIHSGAEVDLILERDGTFYPIEIKQKNHPSKRDTQGITSLLATYPNLRWGPGLIISACPEVMRLNETCWAVPFSIC